MIRSFANTGTEDVFNGHSTKAARKICPDVLWSVARRKLDALDYGAIGRPSLPARQQARGSQR